MISYKVLMHLHLWTVLPCVPLGAALFLMKKGTDLHRLLGKIYMGLMFFTAIVALFLPALVGPQFLGHFGWIHGFCLLTIIVVPRSIQYARRHKIKKHKAGMILLYVGALLIAGAFTLMPGRYLNEVFF